MSADYLVAQFELTEPPTDAISAVKFAPSSPHLLVSSWDKHLYLYSLGDASGRLVQKYEHRAPVLDACWGGSEDELFSGGLDWDVRRCVDSVEGRRTPVKCFNA